MKKILLLASSIVSFSVQAQTLTASTHAPYVGNTYSTYQCDSTGITPGASGAGATWNYSTLNPHTNIQQDFTTSATTNTTYAPADVMVSDAQNSSYFKSTVNDSKYYGGDMVIAGFAINTVFSMPAIAGKYPMSLNTTTSSAVAGTITLNGSLTGPFSGTGGVTADATGTLVLSGRTFNDIVRVKTNQTLAANLTLGSGTVTLVNYSYYSSSVGKAPIITISTSTLVTSLGATNSQTLVTLLKDYTTVSVNEVAKESITLSVFPNPSSSLVNFSTSNTEAVKVTVYDITGKTITTELLNDGKSKLNVSNYNNGIYLYSLIGKSNQVISSGKFNVSK